MSTRRSRKYSEIVFGLNNEDLRQLMSLRGAKGRNEILSLGGVNRICFDLRTSPENGLYDTPADLEPRRKEFGVNVLPTKKSKKFIVLVWEAMQDTTLMILIVCALISLCLSLFVPKNLSKTKNIDWIEGVGILVTVAVVVIVTALNDLAKEKQFHDLQVKMDAEYTCTVIRDRTMKEIVTSEIVVGDICLIKYGDTVPADGIILRSNDLQLDESSITGESEFVSKSLNTDMIVLSGTHVMEGSGKIIVTGVGANSQNGIIQKLLIESATTDVTLTILQVKLTRIAILIGYVGLAFACLTVLILLTQFLLLRFYVFRETWDWYHVSKIIKILIIGITVLVVAVPEGLPLAVTLSLAYSVIKMMNDHNLVRQLHSCETMGNATTICSDKTGTLTTNRMAVTQSYIGEMYRRIPPTYSEIPLNIQHKLVQGIAINCAYTSNIEMDHLPKEQRRQIGNKTECALLGFLDELKEDYRKMRERHPEEKFVRVFAFNSLRKSMSTIIKSPKGYRIYTKGASEIVLEKCSHIVGRYSRILELTDTVRNRIIRSVINPMASNALRTIVIAYRDFVRSDFEPAPNDTVLDGDITDYNEEWIVDNLTCLAIFGIEDPVRTEVPDCIKKCQAAGIVVRMITGDNINTARSIAYKCGIVHKGDSSLVMTSKEFNARIRDANGDIQQELMDTVWPHLRVLARSTPTDKYNLVKGIIESKLSENREVVAVTGDGTNDAPALKKADVGFAMGITGTDVAKQASDIILTDDNFRSIVSAVMWGRNVYDNITKFIQFQLTVNVVAVMLAFIGTCAIHTSVLKAVQMLWVNLVMDTFASLALATEAPTEALLYRRPYGRTKSLISRKMLRNIIGQSVYQLFVVYILLFAGEKFTGVESGRGVLDPTLHFTLVFNTFVMMTLFNEISCRKVNGERNVFKGIFRNWLFIVIWVGSFIIQCLIVQLGSIVFYVVPLPWNLWLWSLGLGVGSLVWQQVILCIPLSSGLKQMTIEEMEDLNIEAQYLARHYFPGFDKSPRNLILWLRGLARYETQTTYYQPRPSAVSHEPKERERVGSVTEVGFF